MLGSKVIAGPPDCARLSPLWILSLGLAVGSCVGPPRPSAAALALERNPRATVEGRVIDPQGRPVAGIRVDGVPRGKEVPWSPPAWTDSEGRFALALVAPAEYGFVLREGKTTVVTDDPRDPSRGHLSVTPGERRGGVELLFLREQWKRELTPVAAER